MPEHGVSGQARRTPQKPALIDGERTRTYEELDRRSNALARALRSLGAEPGKPVAIMLPNSAELVEAATAASKAQCPYVPVNWHLKSAELTYLLSDSGAAVLVTSADLGRFVEGALSSAPGCRALVLGADDAPSYEAVSYEAALNAEDDEPLDGAWETPSWIFYTSGTTGRPKGVVHGALVPAAMALAQQGLMALWGINEDDVHLLSGPGYHAGPSGYVFTTLYAGGTVVVLPDWDPREWLRLVARHRVTTSFMTPAHFIRLLEVSEEHRAQYDLSSLRLIIHAGAPCPVEVKHRILAALPHVEIAELYGASEGGVTRILRDDWLRRPGSVGLPWPGVEVRILDPDARTPLPVGQDGLIYVRPAGDRRFWYHGDEAKTQDAWEEGAFTVGDIGHVDQDGFLYLTDRATDMVLWGGVNVYPREIEEVLHTHPAVVDCAVLGRPDERYGEALHAVVELRSPATPEELREHVRAQLADFKVPGSVDIVQTLPRDPNGKVLKRLLREQPA